MIMRICRCVAGPRSEGSALPLGRIKLLSRTGLNFARCEVPGEQFPRELSVAASGDQQRDRPAQLESFSVGSRVHEVGAVGGVGSELGRNTHSTAAYVRSTAAATKSIQVRSRPRCDVITVANGGTITSNAGPGEATLRVMSEPPDAADHHTHEQQIR